MNGPGRILMAGAAITLAALTPASAPASIPASAPALALSHQYEEVPIRFEARNGEAVEAFQGVLSVPENRADPASRMIELGYVRFPATGDSPGSPIIYLAGGPGGSGTGTAREQRFALFMAMREHGDVIAFDQRGTGLSSNDIPTCRSSVRVPDAAPTDDQALADLYRAAAAQCQAFWREAGVDLAGYTTAQSVADLSDLRAHLGADQMTLWGISYGSHLAMAALDAIPGEIDRVIIASAEGLDQTVKLPARTNAYFDRLQAAVDSQPEAAALYPDIPGLMRRVQARLEAEPVLLTIAQQDGSSYEFLLQRRHAQELASRLISDPANTALLLAFYASLDRGETELASLLIPFFHQPDQPISLRAMPTAMDIASGVSPARRALYERQAETSLVGPYLNFPMPQLSGAIDGLDLGPDFRDGPVGDTPVLLLTGTLDGRTYVEGQAEAVAGLSNVRQIIVKNAGHNLFMSSPDVGAAIAAFMRGEPVPAEIEVDLPDLTRLPF